MTDIPKAGETIEVKRDDLYLGGIWRRAHVLGVGPDIMVLRFPNDTQMGMKIEPGSWRRPMKEPPPHD